MRKYFQGLNIVLPILEELKKDSYLANEITNK